MVVWNTQKVKQIKIYYKADFFICTLGMNRSNYFPLWLLECWCFRVMNRSFCSVYSFITLEAFIEWWLLDPVYARIDLWFLTSTKHCSYLGRFKNNYMSAPHPWIWSRVVSILYFYSVLPRILMVENNWCGIQILVLLCHRL